MSGAQDAVLGERMLGMQVRLEERMERAEHRSDRINEALFSTDPDGPGLMMRMDRIERQIRFFLKVISWIGGGGLVGLIGTLILLYKILGALAEAGV